MVWGIAVLAWLAAAPAPPEGAPGYQAAGRRDPFVSSSGPKLRCGSTRCGGLPGLAVAEIALKGTVQTKGEYLALLAGPDGRTYTARAGQALYDARIVSISEGRATVQMAPDPRDVAGPSGSVGRIIQLTLSQ